MSAVARSLVVFGWYLVGFGALLVLVPNLPFGIVGLPPTGEVWIRVVGLLMLIIGYFDVRIGPEDFLPYARLTVHARVAVLVFLIGFVVAGLVKPVLILVGVVDFAGALWTAAAIRSDPRVAGRPPRG